MNNNELIEKITGEVLKKMSGTNNNISVGNGLIPIASSNRHVHLSEEHFKILFGENQKLSKYKDLSQPGQFAANEKVTLVSKKDVFTGVRILGPFRKQTQVEISRSDAFKLGLNPPIRDSGDLANSEGITIVGSIGSVTIKQGVIIAKRHIHMTPLDARKFGVSDKQIVKVRIFGERSLIFGDVLCRVSDKYALEMHVDTDEGNAAFICNGDLVEIV